MQFNSPVAYRQPRVISRNVFYTGSDAIGAGEGVCYDYAIGTAADRDARRGNAVVRPTTSYNQFFAGVTSQAYSAKTGGQWITIFEPGSIVDVATLIATTVNSTHLSCFAGPTALGGKWATAGLDGRGRARALQTLTAISSPTDYSTGVFSASIDGTAVLTISGTTYTLTKTAAFAGVPATANLRGNEYVWIVAGSTAADGTVQPTPGRYKITAKTDDDNVILDPAGTAPSASTVDVAFYCVRGAPKVLARLEEGRESGMCEWISPDSATAVASMVGGFTHIFGGFTIAADSTATLANGTFIGQRKGWLLSGALTTADYVVTVTAGAGVVDASQASLTLGYSADTLAVLTFDQANELAIVEWSGVAWQLKAWSATAGLVT